VEMIYLTLPRNTKGLSEKENKDLEAKLLLSALQKTDHAVLLDAKGRQLDSLDFSFYIQQIMNRGTKNLGFVIGGAYGFSDEVYKGVKESISLSKMTFPHQLVRLIFAEQLYRAFTIIRGEPYHHE
jgi:23S rRNA (pseudouridine1915-N3)-methyltransferase